MKKSRILWLQMLGRGTPFCEEIRKEKFTIFDCFNGSLIEYFNDATTAYLQWCQTARSLKVELGLLRHPPVQNS